jgi:transposase-like protein
MSVMPPAHPPEFRQRAVELARAGDAPIAKIAKDLGISESCLRNWLRADDVPDDNGGSSEKKELAELRRRNRLLEQENEILRRAAAYFARENVLPK